MSDTDGQPYSFARTWFASQPPKVERLARERYRRAILRYRWPRISIVKAECRRRRNRR